VECGPVPTGFETRLLLTWEYIWISTLFADCEPELSFVIMIGEDVVEVERHITRIKKQNNDNNFELCMFHAPIKFFSIEYSLIISI
jgi:hypothetical protein